MLLVSDLDVRHRSLNKERVRMSLIPEMCTQLIRQVIADDPPKADYNINVFLGQGLVSAAGDVWRHDRRYSLRLTLAHTLARAHRLF
jgi:hypothetical protein